MSNYSEEYKEYLKKNRLRKRLILTLQIAIIVFLILFWELLAKLNIINTFLFASPSLVANTIFNLFKNNNLISHIGITLYETLFSFSITSILGILLATLLWWNNFIQKVWDPYLTVLNSLPKVALGPLIIIWVGASTNSIIVMALMVSLITSIINIYHGFSSTEKNYITLLKSFGASKLQIFTQIVIPYNILNIINTLKINISMSLIGVIMGELLVSKKGLGYLIMYGSQVFNIPLVITSVFILGIVAGIMYYLVLLIEKHSTKNVQ